MTLALALLLATPADFLRVPAQLERFVPPSPGAAFDALNTAVYAADRERDSLLARLRETVVGGDALSSLSPGSFALKPEVSTIVLTGATDGLGKAAASFLSAQGFPVVLCARDTAKGERVAEELRAASPGGGARVSVVACDLSSVVSVEEAASQVAAAAAELGAPLRGLVLNAGVWPGKLQTTEDGLELALQANHVGHWQLADRLLPELEQGLAAGEEARVVTVSSSAHAFASEAGTDDPLWAARPFDNSENYARSKLANMLFAQELAQRAPRAVRSLAVHPGVVLTGLFKELGPSYPAGSGASPSGLSAVEDRLSGLPALSQLREATPLKLVLKSPEEGARPLLYALLAPGLPSGGYVADCELRDIAPAGKGVAARRALWEWTAEWVQKALAAKQGAAAVQEAAPGAAEAVAEPKMEVVEQEVMADDPGPGA